VHLHFEFLESVRIALRAIRVNKLRAVLTTLGIVIGIVSVTAMATVVSGIERGFEQEMSTLGVDVVYIERWPWADGPGSRWWEYINRPRIQHDIAEAVIARSRYADAVTSVVRTGRSVSAGGQTLNGITIGGVTPAYTRVFTVDLAHGTFVSDMDERTARRVAVIGAKIADELFPVGDPIGKAIRIEGQEYRVVGVLVRKGQGADSAQSEDYRVFVPFTAFRSQFGTRWRDVSVQVRIRSGVELEEAKDEIRGIVRLARRLDAKEADDFEINDQATLRAQIEPIKTAIYSIGIGLTALSLLVGGIGVMNIMFVSVKERTREIGIRKAVGARRRTILMQFLVEAVAVSLLGGVIGVLLSIPLALLIKAVMPAYLGPGVVAIAFGICLFIGTVFGLAPAWTAARAEPIDALRYE
jgi:putative ABC transport system permease protein